MKLDVFVVGAFQENTYIMTDEASKLAYIIDPGGDVEQIVAHLENNGLTAKAIINTHGHIDHILGVKALQDILKIPFMLHQADEPLVDQAEASARLFGLQAQGTPKVDDYLQDGQELELGETRIKVLHTPGHSPGGVCFLSGEDVVVGDTLFAMSIGRTDLPGGSFQSLIQSIKTQLLTLDDAVRVHPGHGPMTTIGRERRTNPFIG